MSAFDPFREDDEDEQHTRVYPPHAVESAAGATRTLSPTEHARLMAGVRSPARPPALATPEPEPARQPTRSPSPPPLPTLRRGVGPSRSATPAPRGAEHEVASVHTARCSAALLESLDALAAAREHLRHAGLENTDLIVAEQLLLGVLEAAHAHGWKS